MSDNSYPADKNPAEAHYYKIRAREARENASTYAKAGLKTFAADWLNEARKCAKLAKERAA